MKLTVTQAKSYLNRLGITLPIVNILFTCLVKISTLCYTTFKLFRFGERNGVLL